MPRNARTHDARLILRRAVPLITLFTLLIAPLHANDQPSEREEYLAQQKRMTEEIRGISKNLMSDLQPLTGREEETFSSVMRYGTRETDPDFEILKRGLKAEFFRVTDPRLQTEQQRIRSLRQHLQNRLIGNAAVGIRGPGAKEEFRELVCVESLKILKELLDNNLDARLMAIMLMPELQPVNPPTLEDPKRRILDEAAFTLTDILMDENQPDSVKANAAYAIGVYLDRVNPGGNIEMRIARALVSELESWLPADEYQLLLLTSLAKIRTPREVAGVERRAITFDILTSVLQDKRRSLLIRCHAAGGLGLVGFDAAIKFDPLAWKVVQLAVEVSDAHANQPPSEHWVTCGEQLFVAFRRIDRDHSQDTDGMLNRAPRSEFVRSAYAKVLPLSAGLMLNMSIGSELISDAKTWAAENVPENLTYDAASPPLNP